MTDDFVIVSAYTKNTNYEKIINNLKGDCQKLDIAFHSIAYDTTGVWVENTMLKPFIILKDWDQLSTKYKNLIWIDADARILQYPKYFMELSNDQIDFSVFQMGSIARVTSGTIFIKLTDKMKGFVQEWNEVCHITKDRKGDQQCLRVLIGSKVYSRLNIKYKPLPYSYCYIFDDTLRKLEPSIPKLTEEPIIRHEQASRNQKNYKSK